MTDAYYNTLPEHLKPIYKNHALTANINALSKIQDELMAKGLIEQKEADLFDVLKDRLQNKLSPGPKKSDAHRDNFNHHNTGGDNGPTGHGNICHSDADPGL